MEQKTKYTKNADLRLFSVKEVCERLGIGHWSVYEQIRQNRLKTVKIGKRRLISNRAIEEFIASEERYGA